MTKGSLFKKGRIWYYRFMHNGKRICKAGTESKEETRKMMVLAIADAETSGGIFKPSDIKFSDMLDIWYNECVKDTLRHGTRCDYQNAIKNHIKPYFKDAKLKDITTDILQQYIDEKSKRYAASTMKAHFVVLSGTFKYAVYPKNYIRESPMLYVMRKKINKNIDTFLDIEEESKIEILNTEEMKKVFEATKNTIYYLPVMIAFHTGMRAGEICALMWNDINFKEKTIRVNKSMFYNTELKTWELGMPKGGKARIIEVGDTLLTLMKQVKKEQLQKKLQFGDDYKNVYYQRVTVDSRDHIQLTDIRSDNTVPAEFVCEKDNGDAFTNQTVKCGVKMIKKETGLPFYFHMIRHTHATMLIENGANMKDVQERLGHTDIKITMNTYSHVTPKMRKQTVDIFEKAIL